MNPATVELLRAATIQALQNKQDTAAVELLSLMNVAPKPTVKALPQATPEVEVVEGPMHDYHYWTQFIRNHFIPFMTANGRLRFSSHELMTWLENCQTLQLTTGDMEQQTNGQLVWRHQVSCALGTLKTQGVLNAPPFGKEYVIQTPALKSGEA